MQPGGVAAFRGLPYGDAAPTLYICSFYESPYIKMVGQTLASADAGSAVRVDGRYMNYPQWNGVMPEIGPIWDGAVQGVGAAEYNASAPPAKSRR